MSGDGTIHELINGLLTRPDINEISMFIGAVPIG